MSKQEIAGTIKFFNEQKGWGFAVADDKGSDIFVHATKFKHLTGLTKPEAGDRILGRVKVYGARRKFVEIRSITPPLTPRVNGKSYDSRLPSKPEKPQRPVEGTASVDRPRFWGDGYVLSLNDKGAAFIRLDGGVEVYVNKHLVNGLMRPLRPDDEVRVRYYKKRGGGRKGHLAEEIYFA